MGCIVGQGGPADEPDAAPFRTQADLDPVVDAADLPTVLGPVDPNQDAFRSLLDLDAAGVTIDDAVERKRAVDAANLEGVDALERPTHRRLAGGAANDELRDERIIECGHDGSGRHPGVDPNLAPGGHSKVDDPTGRRKEISERVFGIDPALDRVAFPAHLAL